MAHPPVYELKIIERFGPHLSGMSGVSLSTSAEPERLVKTHCCFCGQQCGVQLKVRDNEVIGFEPWEEFPFNRGMLCPKGVKRYLQGAHPDRLTAALRRALARRRDELDPRKFLLEATAAARAICTDRFLAFGCAGQGGGFRPVPLEKMATRYAA